MPIDRANFDEVSEIDLKELIETKVPEGLRLEYKREMYGNSDAEKREALKDISALANSAGGHLLIGVEEADGLPIECVGIAGDGTDDLLLRLESLVRSGIEPRIQGVRMRALTLGSGRACIAVRVPRSWNAPHRVSAQNSNRYWIRSSAGCHEASVDELRAMFTQSTHTLERIEAFHRDRLARIFAGQGPRPLERGGRLVVHIVPLAAFASSVSISLEDALKLHQSFAPLKSGGMSPRFNIHGMINERGGEQNHGYTQIFRNGVVEATVAMLIRDRGNGLRGIPGRALERYLMEALPSYVDGLRKLDVQPPMFVLMTLEGVSGCSYFINSSAYDDPEPPFQDDVVSLPTCSIEDIGDERSVQQALRPMMDTLWNAAGYSRAQSFDKDGRWSK